MTISVLELYGNSTYEICTTWIFQLNEPYNVVLCNFIKYGIQECFFYYVCLQHVSIIEKYRC